MNEFLMNAAGLAFALNFGAGFVLAAVLSFCLGPVLRRFLVSLKVEWDLAGGPRWSRINYPEMWTPTRRALRGLRGNR